eukprot:tig00000293_g23886.t1
MSAATSRVRAILPRCLGPRPASWILHAPHWILYALCASTASSAPAAEFASLRVCEFLLSTRACTLFATHFDALTELAVLYPNVRNYHLRARPALYPPFLPGPTGPRQADARAGGDLHFRDLRGRYRDALEVAEGEEGEGAEEGGAALGGA